MNLDVAAHHQLINHNIEIQSEVQGFFANMFSLFFCSAFVLLDFLILETQGKVFVIWLSRIFLRPFTVISAEDGTNTQTTVFSVLCNNLIRISLNLFSQPFNFVLAIILAWLWMLKLMSVQCSLAFFPSF